MERHYILFRRGRPAGPTPPPIFPTLKKRFPCVVTYLITGLCYEAEGVLVFEGNVSLLHALFWHFRLSCFNLTNVIVYTPVGLGYSLRHNQLYIPYPAPKVYLFKTDGCKRVQRNFTRSGWEGWGKLQHRHVKQ